jgi:hypothetical protein
MMNQKIAGNPSNIWHTAKKRSITVIDKNIILQRPSTKEKSKGNTVDETGVLGIGECTIEGEGASTAGFAARIINDPLAPCDSRNFGTAGDQVTRSEWLDGRWQGKGRNDTGWGWCRDINFGIVRRSWCAFFRPKVLEGDTVLMKVLQPTLF